MASSPSVSTTSSKGSARKDASDSERGDMDADEKALLSEYIDTLPSFIEVDICPPLVDCDEPIECKFARLDHEALKECAITATQRYNEALYELLDQDVALSDTQAEMRYLESELNDKEEDLEMLRLQLQAADDYIDALLREKADALRKLTEAKNELAQISTKAANLQRDLEVKARREKVLTDSLASTPRTTAADATRSSAQSVPAVSYDSCTERSRQEVERGDANLWRKLLRRTVSQKSPKGPTSTGDEPLGVVNVITSPIASDFAEYSFRELSLRVQDPRQVWSVQGAEAEAVSVREPDTPCNKGAAEFTEWRRLFYESQKQREFLEKELAKARACCVGGTEMANQKVQTQVRNFTQELQWRLRRNVAELERMERELTSERERARKQGRLELQLLKDVGRLARRLRTYESAASALRSQRRADQSRSREELIEELSRCRLTISELTTRASQAALPEPAAAATTTLAGAAGGAPGDDKTSSKSEASMTVGLAAALEEALAVNEGLRAEKECVLADKRIREAAYEAELRSRIAEMEELTSALHELREQVNQLRKQRPFGSPLQRRSTQYGSPRSPRGSDMGVKPTFAENVIPDTLNPAEPQ
ncbi:hypothetical protein DQ04_00261090 [Trypanosoma grayi]|uniref:hypothetical protein n=1 Tax=Trypanosoma grayi TaxID=71804 RepID=UPI0004F41306|nr:hypothetical protein DQ04_00261090 [Trypanosoma grayi]KEG14910.1 hypothetical protein DQ04_00261090 [Trypanosoma grayi]